MKWFKDKKNRDKYVNQLKYLYEFTISNKKDVFEGYVYIFKCEEYYKIGRATNLAKRFYQISTSSPFEISIIASKKVRNCVFLEDLLHRTMSEYRKKGEWFELPNELLDVVTTLLNNID